MRRGIHLGKPLRRKLRHAAHPFIVRAENNIFSRALRHMPVKQGVQSIGFIKRTPERLEIPLSLVTHCLTLGMGNAAPISRQALLARESRENILRRCKNAAYYRLAERHLGRNIAVKKFISHVPLIAKIADCRGRQPENGHIRIH